MCKAINDTTNNENPTDIDLIKIDSAEEKMA